MSSEPKIWLEAYVLVQSGWKVISGGASVSFFGHGKLLTRSFPLWTGQRAPYGWNVLSKCHHVEDEGLIQAFATAMYDPNDDMDVKVDFFESTPMNHPTTRVRVSDKYTLVDGGADVLWKGYENLLVDNYPSHKTQE